MCPDKHRNQNTQCAYPGCARKVWRDPDGSYSSYCGNTHRLAMASFTNAANLCKHCQVKPKYVENGKTHDFCGIRCAKAYRAGQPPPASPSPAPSLRLTSSAGNGVCRLAGCSKPVFVGQDGNASEYCSQAHARHAVQQGLADACLLCTSMPKAIVNGEQSDFCSSKCKQEAERSAPVLLKIDSRSVTWNNVSKQFRDQWKHNTVVPNVVKIYKLISKKDQIENFFRYKHSVERRTGLQDGNAKRRWHGTTRCCRVGDSDHNTGLCGLQICSLCSILRTSFDILRSGSNHNFGRFGRGIYTSATSSKAHDYNQELGGSIYKSVILSEVVVGKPIKLTQDNTSLKEPPTGYDSVIGEPAQGGSLNYDELVVYRNDAIRPLYLILHD